MRERISTRDSVRERLCGRGSFIAHARCASPPRPLRQSEGRSRRARIRASTSRSPPQVRVPRAAARDGESTFRRVQACVRESAKIGNNAELALWSNAQRSVAPGGRRCTAAAGACGCLSAGGEPASLRAVLLRWQAPILRRHSRMPSTSEVEVRASEVRMRGPGRSEHVARSFPTMYAHIL